MNRLPLPHVASWDWQKHAACRGMSAERFFSPDGEQHTARRQRREDAAKKVCQHCPVLASCRQHALAVGEPYGVWGGLTPKERERISR